MVIHKVGGSAKAVCGVNVCDRGEGDLDAVFLCPHYPLWALVIKNKAIPIQALIQLLRILSTVPCGVPSDLVPWMVSTWDPLIIS